jgi:hypothetical protein
VLTDEDKKYDFTINNFSLAVILSLSTSVRGNFFSSAGYYLPLFGYKRVENAEKRE